MTLPEEGPEQRWRRTVRKRPAKLKLGRLLRDFGYAELDADAAEAIEGRMASVGLAIRPSLQVAAADEIVTVYRAEGATDDDARPAGATLEAAVPAVPAVRAVPAVPAAPVASDAPWPKPRRASDPSSARATSDLQGQLADARAESGRLRAELDSRITAMGEADRMARERITAQTALVGDQARQLADLHGLLAETRAALAEARDEIRRAVSELPAAVLDAPVDEAGLVDEEGWLTDADESLPPAPLETAVLAIAVAPGSFADADEPELPAAGVPEADYGLDAEADVPSAEDGFGVEPDAPVEHVFASAQHAPPDDATLAFELDAQPEGDGPAAEASPPDEDIFGPDAEDPSTDAVTLEPDAAPEPTVIDPEPEPPRRSGFFTIEPPAPPPQGNDDADEPLPPIAAADDDREPLQDENWSLDDAWTPSERLPTRSDTFPEALSEHEPAAAQDGPVDAPDDDVPAPGDPDELWDVRDDVPADALKDVIQASEPPAWDDVGPGSLPAPPPLPPSPFADDPPAAPPQAAPARPPARRGRMARGRGQWHGTCSVCERSPEVTRRRDLEAAGWQLDGDFPTCPQCRGLG